MKKADEKNSLEQLLLRWKSSYEENKTKTNQFLVVFLLVVVVVVLFRSGAFRGTNKDDLADTVYYRATQASFAGVDSPDAQTLADTASAYSSEDGAILHLDSGEAYVRRGIVAIERKQRYSSGVKLAEGEELIDPVFNFEKAVEEFEKGVTSSNADLKARAYYGIGVAQEALASVTDGDDAVVAALDAAKTAYEEVAKVCDNSPYVALATDRLDNLSKDLTVTYYKTVANTFVTLPDPKDSASILSGKDELEIGEPVKVDPEFNVNEGADGESEATDENGASATE